MPQTYDEMKANLAVDGMQRVWPAKRCKRCRTSNTMMSKAHKLQICFHCNELEKKSTRARPFKAAMLATLLLLLAGCASAPSRASVEIKVAGQSVVMNFKK